MGTCHPLRHHFEKGEKKNSGCCTATCIKNTLFRMFTARTWRRERHLPKVLNLSGMHRSPGQKALNLSPAGVIKPRAAGSPGFACADILRTLPRTPQIHEAFKAKNQTTLVSIWGLWALPLFLFPYSEQPGKKKKEIQNQSDKMLTQHSNTTAGYALLCCQHATHRRSIFQKEGMGTQGFF